MPLSVVQEGAGCPKGHGPEDLRVRANGVRDCRACANERAKRRRRVGRAAARGRPLILSATRTASEQIARLAPGVVIENAVQAALERGEARRTRSGDALVVETRRPRLGGGRRARREPVDPP